MASVNFGEEKAITINLANDTPITTEVSDINYIPSYKVAEEERRTNELKRIANENERITNETERKTYYNDFQSKVNSGYFDGASGVYVGSEEPTDEDINVWIDPNGNPEVEAKNIVFADNETLQTKYENGELKGEKGDKGADGTMSFSDLTEEQKASLKGEKGDKGDTGEQGVAGKDGTNGYTPVKGVDYFTEEDIASLNIPTRTSELTNDSGFLISEKKSYSTNEQIIGTWINGETLYRKVLETTINNSGAHYASADTQISGMTTAVKIDYFVQTENGIFPNSSKVTIDQKEGNIYHTCSETTYKGVPLTIIVEYIK